MLDRLEASSIDASLVRCGVSMAECTQWRRRKREKPIEQQLSTMDVIVDDEDDADEMGCNLLIAYSSTVGYIRTGQEERRGGWGFID